jgi:hypothetical protein
MRVKRPSNACKETCECMQRYLLIERCKEKYSYYNALFFIFWSFFVGGGSATPAQNLLMRPSNLVMRAKRATEPTHET